ncbi:hypothetical protein [Kitasatospora purpeofusca]|uniref:hypothetical protein n=1 Tax=Kitasatospora purpeofusca TaxID=67352 RepID=UPI00386E6820|nr:hypothetical protein OIP63_22950 [Kitasatospora purpeofusca]
MPSVRSMPPCASTATTTQPPAVGRGIQRTHSCDLAFDALPQSCAAWCADRRRAVVIIRW